MVENPDDLRKHFGLWLDLRREQGADVSAVEEKAAGALADAIAALKETASAPGLPCEEPNDLEAICAARPAGPRRLPLELDEEELLDKTLGAWVGRSAGCMLGIPVEGRPGKEVCGLAKMLDSYPLRQYWPGSPHVGEHGGEPMQNYYLGNITHVGCDDDLCYTVLGILALEQLGVDFTSRRLGELWVERLPRACTAEAVALRNMQNHIWPPESARVNNPYCEWIGAAIRADPWGYAAAGLPAKAAEFAWRDAVISHERNGIYAEMFFSALMAAAFAEPDLERLIEIGLSEIPSDCRFAEMVKDTVAWCKQDDAWDRTCERVMEKYGRYHRVHAINNGALVLLALLHGAGDFADTIGISVMAGLDTDCNGATAGSIMGILLGERGIPAEWKECFNDTILSYVRGEERNTLSGLARRTRAVARQVRKEVEVG